MTQLLARIEPTTAQIAPHDTGTGLAPPRQIADAGPDTEIRLLEFFAATIRNPHTRRAYARTIGALLDWCCERGVPKIAEVKPLHVSAWIEARTQTHSAPTVKQCLAAIRHLFDWLVVGQIVSHNPAAAVCGPKHVVKKGKTPVLDAAEARVLIHSIDVATNVGLRNRALIGLMVYSFARIGAAVGMKVEGVYMQNRRHWVRLREKGGKRHEMPCHHNLELYLTEYLERTGLGADPKAWLFPTIRRDTDELTSPPLPHANAYAMIQLSAKREGLKTKIGNHSFRATGITTYLKNSGTLEKAAAMANHASTRTTQLYDRRSNDVSLDEVERVII
jgi:site-specific recombinase XerD